MNRPFVSVIIPTFNRAELLPMTLESFLTQKYPSDFYEIIIANNNSTDNTQEVIDRYCTNFTCVKEFFEYRQGVHYARNEAAKIARGDILFFTDDDMIAEPDLLCELIQVFKSFPDVGCATGLILPRFEVDPPAWVRRCLWNSYLSLTERNKPEELIITKNDIVFSCHQAVRRLVFFQAGGFNPENTAGTWIGDGETGLNIKIKALGYRFAYTSSSVIYHVIPKARMTLSYLVRRIGNQGYCDSYTEYRNHRQKGRIFPEMLKRSTVGAVKLLVITLGKIMLGLESWHFIPARIAYLYRRNVYDLKLYFDDDFRRVAEIDDWLSEENKNISIKSI